MKRWRSRKDEELGAEIRSHLDEAIRDRIARGESPDEARANALRELDPQTQEQDSQTEADQYPDARAISTALPTEVDRADGTRIE
jgi:hypothetical protein